MSQRFSGERTGTDGSAADAGACAVGSSNKNHFELYQACRFRINGTGIAGLMLSGNQSFDIFGLAKGTDLILSGMTLTNGQDGIELEDNSQLLLNQIAIESNSGYAINGDDRNIVRD